jgi:HD-like signal output (HDOD) protein
MDKVISQSERDALLKNLVIPPRPAVLDSLLALRNDPDISLQKIGAVLETDMALSVAVLKAANSPLVPRTRPIGSVQQAISLLGSKNVINLISGLVVRTHLTGAAPPSIELYWERAMVIAQICKALCDHIGHTPEDCPSYALFHSCGIALMLMRYQNFERTLQLIEMAPDDRVTRIEHELHGTSHDVVGYLVGRAWNMPEHFCQSILHQFDPDAFNPDAALPIDQEARLSIALTRAATNVWRTQTPGNVDAGWAEREESALRMLGIGRDEFDDWRDGMHHRLARG